MIDWINNGSIPKPNQHIIIKMPDGRVFGCKVDENASSIHLDYVDNLDLLTIMGRKIEWYPVDQCDHESDESGYCMHCGIAWT